MQRTRGLQGLSLRSRVAARQLTETWLPSRVVELPSRSQRRRETICEKVRNQTNLLAYAENKPP